MSGKVVLVTGGSAGIGKAAAQLFAEAGASVVIAARGTERGRQTEREIRATGSSVLFVQTDVSQANQVQSLIARTVEAFGRLDCAFNNAATLSKLCRAGDFTEADFDAEVNANLKSVWLCMKFQLEQMQKQEPRGGVIVNTSSVNGLGGARFAALYSMSKAGVLALTKSAAQEYAADGIRVNALVAGAFDTEMLQSAISQAVGGDTTKAQEALKGYVAHVPAGRNLFHATAQANAEGKHLLAESVLKIRDQADARKLADARKMIESFQAHDAQEGQDGGQP